MKKPCEITTDGSSPKHNNRVVEPKLVGGVGEINFGKQYRQGNRIYCSEEVACALMAQPIGNAGGESYLYRVYEPMVYDGFNGQVRADSTTIGTITRNVGADLKRNGQGIIEPLSEYEKEMKNGKEILCVLRETFDEETLLEWGIGVLYAIIKTEILRQNMYAKRVLEDWEGNANLSKFTSNSKESERLNIEENHVRDLWEEVKIRCASLGRRFPEQRIEQFESYMQKLSLEATQGKIFVQSLWEADGWGIGLLQQALLAVQKIWQPECCEEVQRNFRVRKLTEKEAFRLQGVKDTDFAKIRQNQSKSSCYHLAGDSITTSVLMALFGQMLGIDWRSKVDELVDELQGE